jgi:hypothetical protein
MKFRKKPVVIDAIEFDGTPEARQRVLEWGGLNATNASTIYWRGLPDGNGEIVIRTLEGDLVASAGDFIIRGVKGEVYPCKPDVFAITYEPVDSAEPDA